MPENSHRTVFPFEVSSIYLFIPGEASVPFQFRDFLVSFRFFDADGVEFPPAVCSAPVTEAFNEPFMYLKESGVEGVFLETNVARFNPCIKAIDLTVHPWKSQNLSVLELITESIYAHAITAESKESLIWKVAQ
ncbi:hypothetical protein [Corynebacterium sp. HMSC078H07]|uniref:hypothetical protein n=1 Tax=Corynebacterium sp. HMSC078H07 TaxID=1739379 RepID=UPI0008A62F17|nr:hypothetical protein [Corynebacterium sp. HMSC078H07]OFR62933.1 hypothetical protein HMPREF2875_03105 [Corynebacterium sp. HMSC078H07]